MAEDCCEGVHVVHTWPENGRAEVAVAGPSEQRRIATAEQSRGLCTSG